MPMTSPVDFISGPRITSTPGNLMKGNTASLTAMCPTSRSVARPRSARRYPSITLVASLARGTPMALETKGRGREDRELDIQEPDHAELPGQGPRLDLDALDLIVAQRVGRQRAGGVAGVNACLL